MSHDQSALLCEMKLDGELARGEVRDLSYAGFFVKTATRLEPGTEVELRLIAGAGRQPVYLTVVVESCVTPGAFNPLSPAGLQVRLLRYELDFGSLLAGSTGSHEHAGDRPSRTAQTRNESEREWLSNMLSPPTGEQPKPQRADPSAAWAEFEPAQEAAVYSLSTRDGYAPEAIVIDEGELDDIVNMLGELGIKTVRQRPNPELFGTQWVRPQHLLIATAKCALKLRLQLETPGYHFTPIAVVDGDARTAYSAVRNIGYQYAICRPIHPLAMSMLLRQAAYPHDEHREIPREVLGCTVAWWPHWGRKRDGVLLDLSQGGCRLLADSDLTAGTPIKIRMPSGLANGGRFTLAGEVVRSTREGGRSSMGVKFGELSEKVERRLNQVLTLPGPCRVHSDSNESDDLVRIEPELHAEERRKKVRASVQQEVVALDFDSPAVKYVMVSRDLSVDGMRVEANPNLELDDELKLALFEDRESEPLLLRAVVARDDGPDGWWLRFVNPPESTRERLVRALKRYPPVARLDGRETEAERVVLSQVLDTDEMVMLDEE